MDNDESGRLKLLCLVCIKRFPVAKCDTSSLSIINILNFILKGLETLTCELFTQIFNLVQHNVMCFFFF